MVNEPDLARFTTAARAAEVSAALATFERGGKPTISKIRYTHDAMIDLIVQDPAISQNALAEYFGYSASWISIVINTDMFQAALARRREEIINPILRASLEDRFRAVTQRSLEVLGEKLAKDSDAVPDQLALRAAELGAKALGLGGNAPQVTVPVDVNIRLEGLAARLTGLLGKAKTEIIDV